METYLTIFVLTFGLIFMAVIGLGIGWLLTGRSRLNRRCGTRPGKQNTDCGTNNTCELCDPSMEGKKNKSACKDTK